MSKQRLDLLMLDRGLAESREKARALILAGVVFADGNRADKAGTLFPETADLEIKGETLRYVSRGGLKLEKALEVFSIDPSEMIAADIGASTGGFTDCLLQHGAKRVYAVDVGYGQFAWSLRQDARVKLLERTNARYLTKEQIPEQLDFFSIDVSFISLGLIFPALFSLTATDSRGVCLIKPQFEAGRSQVGKHGVVSDPDVHCDVIKKVISFLSETPFGAWGLTHSPIRGPKGNIEFLLYIGKQKNHLSEGEIADAVHMAHRELHADRPAT